MSSDAVMSETDGVKANASQLGLTTGVMFGLYSSKKSIVPALLSIALFLPLGAVASQGYSWIVFFFVLFVALRESLGVIEYAHLHDDTLLDKLKNLAARSTLYSGLAFTLLSALVYVVPQGLNEALMTSIFLGAVSATCAPLFGIAGMNYLLGASKVDTDKLATLNKYGSMTAGIFCALAFFSVRNPTSLKMLAIMAAVSYFSFVLLKKTEAPELTQSDLQQTRSGATLYAEPTLNFAYFMIVFAAVSVLLLYLGYTTGKSVSFL